MRCRKLAAVLLLLLPFAALANAQSIQINRENKTIAISTTDEATATADIAAITIGFDVYNDDSDAAYAEGSQRSKAIIEALHKAGIADASIESSDQQLSRVINYAPPENSSTKTRKDFKFSQSWEVSVAPDRAAAVIRIAVAAGANLSGEIEWRLADRKALQAKAAANALIKARTVATQMADGLHVKPGALIYASNEAPKTHLYFVPPPPNLNDRIGSSQQTVEVSAEAVGSLPLQAPPLEIRPQTIREEATVYAVFAIE
jgi:uncharacterized protein YggE